VLLVLGANGQLGQGFKNTWPDDQVTYVDRNECDITKTNEIAATLDRYKPTVTINCAAYTDVNKAETDVGHADCTLINTTAVKNLAIETEKRNIPLIHISTDYVFDGQKNTPYTTMDVPSPLNHYGQSKLDGENAFLKHARCGAIIRVSHLSSEFGKNIVKTFHSLLTRLPEMNVVNDQTICLTTTADVVKFVYKISKQDHLKNSTEIYHLGSKNSFTFFELATEIKNIIQSKTTLTPVSLETFSGPVKRPIYSVLDTKSVQDIIDCPSWKKSVRDIIQKLENEQ
jgi:dTDP-4-dehydrorhamnose reductase